MAHQIPFIPGATTIGIVCKNGVILASEKRVSYGYLVLSKAGKKVFKVTDRVGTACAGLVSDMQNLARQATAYTFLHTVDSNRASSVNSVAKLMANLLFEQRLFPLLTQTIVGGIDEKGPSLYVLDPLGSILPDKYACVGSGTEIAVGIVEEGYREDMTVEEAKKLVLRSLKAAASRDVQSGDGADFLIITPEGIVEETVDIK